MLTGKRATERDPAKSGDACGRARRRRGQKGQSIVETALVLLTLLGMVIFVMDMGRILMMEQFISERARTTARHAAVNNWTATQVQNYLVYGSTAAGSGTGFLGLLPSQVTYTVLGTPGAPDYRLQVKVSGIPALTWIPFISGRYTLPPVIDTVPAESLGVT